MYLYFPGVSQYSISTSGKKIRKLKLVKAKAV